MMVWLRVFDPHDRVGDPVPHTKRSETRSHTQKGRRSGSTRGNRMSCELVEAYSGWTIPGGSYDSVADGVDDGVAAGLRPARPGRRPGPTHKKDLRLGPTRKTSPIFIDGLLELTILVFQFPAAAGNAE